jgi:cytochrome c
MDAADDQSVVNEFNAPVPRPAGHYGYGEEASESAIAGWDIDIRPDGMGLPFGSGSVEDGELLYEEKCAWCHGSFGEGVDRYPVLAGGDGTLKQERPEKTVGSYWPYASTLWDYIHRAMPFAEPESLTDDEVYAISAYVLYLNDLVDYEFVLTQENLASIKMPNQDGFFIDDRPDVTNIICMENCKDAQSIRITSEPPPSEEPTQTAVGTANVSKTASGESVYQQACALCHASGLGEAPIPGDEAAWSARLARGHDSLVANAIEGMGAMPPKGGQVHLTDEEVAAAVDFMVAQPGNSFK